MAKREYEYEIYAETPDKKKKKEYWEAAIGRQKVDGLKPSDYLIGLAQKKHRRGSQLSTGRRTFIYTLRK